LFGGLKKMQEILEEHPGLLNASWDWGRGNFETGTEDVVHVGNKDIEKFRFGKGSSSFCFPYFTHSAPVI